MISGTEGGSIIMAGLCTLSGIKNEIGKPFPSICFPKAIFLVCICECHKQM